MVIFNLQSCSAPLVLKMGKQRGIHNRRDQRNQKSLANRKGFVICFRTSVVPVFAVQTRKKTGVVSRAGFICFVMMTTLETHTLGKGQTCVREGEKAKWLCALLSAWFQPKPSPRKTWKRQKRRKKGRGAPHQMCIKQHKRCISLQPWSTSVPAKLL